MEKFNFIKEIISDFKKTGTEVTAIDMIRRSIGTPDDFARPYLRKVVAEAEKASGKTLLNKDSPNPLQYLGSKVTIGMIHRYFSDEGCPEIEKIRKDILLLKHPKSKLDRSDIRKSLTRKYAYLCGLKVNESIEKRKVQECFLEEIPGDWKSPVFELEDLAQITICKDGQYISWINQDTTVKELLDVFCSLA